jgi:small conductance mechanosensitive channel
MSMSVLSAKELTADLLIRYGFQLLGALVILAAGALLARWLGAWMSRWLTSRTMEPPVRMLIVRTVRVIVLVFTAVVALDKFGFQVAPLVAGIGVAGLGIGFALQGVLSNVIAGLSIILTKPFRVGEYISILGVQGEVRVIELFSTTLAHPDRSRVVIPNRKIVGEILQNYGVVRQLALKVDIDYGADLDQVQAAARDVVARNPRVLRDPAPLVGVSALGGSGVSLLVAPWVSVADYEAARAELYPALLREFHARGVALPLPRQEVRLINAA